MAYVYRHIRLDKNIPFYIGVGKDSCGFYKRANALHGRNGIWYNIVAKTAYKVEILFDNLSYKEAEAKEIELITLHRRIKDGGTLANIALGGSGQLGISRPAWNKGISPRRESVEKQRRSLTGKFVGSKHPFFGKKHKPESIQKMIDANLGQIPWNKGKKLSEEEKLHCGVYNNRVLKPVLQLNLNGEIIKEYPSLGAAARENNVRKSSIARSCLRDRALPIYGFLWRYK